MPPSLVILKVGERPTRGTSGTLVTRATWDGSLSTRKACIGCTGKCLEQSGAREMNGVTSGSPPASADSLTPQST